MQSQLRAVAADAQKRSLMSGSGGAGSTMEGKSNDEYLDATVKVQDKTQTSLFNTLNMIESAKQVRDTKRYWK